MTDPTQGAAAPPNYAAEAAYWREVADRHGVNHDADLHEACLITARVCETLARIANQPIAAPFAEALARILSGSAVDGAASPKCECHGAVNCPPASSPEGRDGEPKPHHFWPETDGTGLGEGRATRAMSDALAYIECAQCGFTLRDGDGCPDCKDHLVAGWRHLEARSLGEGREPAPDRDGCTCLTVAGYRAEPIEWVCPVHGGVEPAVPVSGDAPREALIWRAPPNVAENCTGQTWKNYAERLSMAWGDEQRTVRELREELAALRGAPARSLTAEDVRAMFNEEFDSDEAEYNPERMADFLNARLGAVPPSPRSEPTSDETRDMYLSGPMTGYAEFNYPAFHAATKALRERGLTVWNPAENFAGRTDLSHADYVREDLRQVLLARSLAVLPGWERSRGAAMEVAVARIIGIPVVDALTNAPISAPSRPSLDTETRERYDEARGYLKRMHPELFRDGSNASGTDFVRAADALRSLLSDEREGR